MEHVVLVFAQFVVAIDRLFQKRLRTALPQVDDLLRDPIKVLTENEITIGPMRRYAMSVILGSGLGFCVCCGFSGYRMDHPRPNNGPAPWWELLLVLTGMVIVTGCVAVLIERWVRGGQLILRLQGVVFRHRADSVFIPWSAISSDSVISAKDNFVHLQPGAIVIEALVHSRHGFIATTGAQVWTKPVSVRKDRRVTLENLYAVRLDEICELFAKLSHILAPFSPPIRVLERGEPAPEEMI